MLVGVPHMKLQSPSYATLAAIAYGVFCAFGIAVWHTLLFVALPKGATPLSTLQDLLLLEPADRMLWFHAAATLATGCLAVLLMLKPPTGATQYRSLAVTSALIAALTWAVFPSDLAILPTVAAGSLVWGWFNVFRAVRQ